MARQFKKIMAVSLFGTISALSFAAPAQAACNGGAYCNASSGQHAAYHPPALSTWSHHNVQTQNYVTAAPRHVTYAKTSPVRYTNVSYSGPVTSSRQAPCPAGSTRQSDGICLSTMSMMSSSHTVAPLTRNIVTGLGVNESLRPTTCPVAVHNPSGAKVLGCYNVVKPKPIVRTVVRTVPTVYRVVRPIVYVQRPVPVCNTCCTPTKIKSRYGAIGPAAPKCGW